MIADNQVESFLDHHGVKGQKWGVRNVSRADKKWYARMHEPKHIVKAHNMVADKLNGKGPGSIHHLNNQPKYKNHKGPLINEYGAPQGKIGEQYVRDYNNIQAKHSVDALHKIHGVSPSGKYKVGLDTSNPDRHHSRIMDNTVQHLAMPDDTPTLPEFNFVHKKDKKGRIQAAIPAVAMHSSDVDIFLEHYGVKGMQRKTSTPERLSRVARVASGTEARNKNLQAVIKAKLKAISDAVKTEDKKKKEKELEEFLKIIDSEAQTKAAEFIKEQSKSPVKEFTSTGEESSATSNE